MHLPFLSSLFLPFFSQGLYYLSSFYLLLFLLRHDLMCLSNNRRKRIKSTEGQRMREVRMKTMGGLSVVSQPVLHFLCYPFSMWEKSIPPFSLLSGNDKDSRDNSSLHKGKLIPQGCKCVCDTDWVSCENMSLSSKSPGGIFPFASLTNIMVLLWFCWGSEIPCNYITYNKYPYQ